MNVAWELSSHEVTAIQSCTCQSHHIRVINRSTSQAGQRSRSPTSDLHLSLLSSKSTLSSIADYLTWPLLTLCSHSQGQILGEHPAFRPVVVPLPSSLSVPSLSVSSHYLEIHSTQNTQVTTLIRMLLDNTEPPHQNQKGH